MGSIHTLSSSLGISKEIHKELNYCWVPKNDFTKANSRCLNVEISWLLIKAWINLVDSHYCILPKSPCHIN